MVCIYCSSSTQVMNSRLQKRLNQVWRRRKCSACGNTFTTHETIDLTSSVMVQYSSSKLSPFNKDILLLSIYESCKHRPTAIDDAVALTQTIISLLRGQLANSIVQRDTIIDTAMSVLGHFDKPAATIYKAYHP